MSKSCNNCHHVNTDAAAYCAQCGVLLPMAKEQTVVAKADYEKLKAASSTIRVSYAVPAGKVQIARSEYARLQAAAKVARPTTVGVSRGWVFFSVVLLIAVLFLTYHYFASVPETDPSPRPVADANGRWGLDDANGHNLLPCEYDAIVKQENAASYWYLLAYRKYYGVANAQGVQTVNSLCDSIVKDHFRNYYRLYSAGLVGMMDASGNLIVGPKYKAMGNLAQDWLGSDLLPVQGPRGYGFVDKNGTEVVAPVNIFIAPCREGLAFVRKSRRDSLRCVNARGEQVFATGMYYLAPFGESLAAVSATAFSRPADARVGFIDRNGSLVIPADYGLWLHEDGSTWEEPRFVDGYAKVSSNGENGYLNHDMQFSKTRP